MVSSVVMLCLQKSWNFVKYIYLCCTKCLKILYDTQRSKDPMILFSFINMKLRDEYSSLSALCEDMEIEEEELTAKLKSVGFEYSEENNKFW